MKSKILTILTIFISLMSYAQPKAHEVKEPKYFCVQILSTQNPQLLTKEHVDIVGEPVFGEMVIINGVTYHRIMLVYSNELDAKNTLDVALGIGFHYSLICVRSKTQVDNMYPLFTNINNG